MILDWVLIYIVVGVICVCVSLLVEMVVLSDYHMALCCLRRHKGVEKMSEARLVIHQLRNKGFKWCQIARITRVDAVRVRDIADGAEPTPKELESIELCADND